MPEVRRVDSTSIIDYLLGIVAQVHNQMKTGTGDSTIQWKKSLLIQDLSQNDALMQFCQCQPCFTSWHPLWLYRTNDVECNTLAAMFHLVTSTSEVLTAQIFAFIASNCPMKLSCIMKPLWQMIKWIFEIEWKLKLLDLKSKYLVNYSSMTRLGLKVNTAQRQIYTNNWKWGRRKKHVHLRSSVVI